MVEPAESLLPFMGKDRVRYALIPTVNDIGADDIAVCVNRSAGQHPIPKDSFDAGEEARCRVRRFHETLPGFRVTPLVRLRGLSHRLGLADLRVKDEAGRLNLNAFKILGASYAAAVVLTEMLELSKGAPSLEALTAQGSALNAFTLITATDGNHGRAVAWVARAVGCRARIYIPGQTSDARSNAITGLGAEVIRVDGNYDDAVLRAATSASEAGGILIQDTAWEGYERIPKLIMQGYMTLLSEIRDQWPGEGPTHVFAQAGVGSLAASLSLLLRQGLFERRPRLIIVETDQAACFYQGVNGGSDSPERIEGALDSIMAGLACGEANPIAWDILRSGGDGFVCCSDRVAISGMRLLGRPLDGDSSIVSGESGAVTAGLLNQLMLNPLFEKERKDLALDQDARVLLISTEGETDPGFYRETVARPASIEL